MPPTSDIGVEVPEVVPARDNTRVILLCALGVVTAIAVGVILGSRKKSPQLLPYDVPDAEDTPWSASLKHLAGAWDIRFAAIEDQLKAMSSAGVSPNGAHVSIPVPDAPPTPAAVSLPPENAADASAAESFDGYAERHGPA